MLTKERSISCFVSHIDLVVTSRLLTLLVNLLVCRVGDITLEDFKIAIKKEGSYRYVFKALDPELGTVKEEVNNFIS